jgi:hypothetical protein
MKSRHADNKIFKIETDDQHVGHKVSTKQIGFVERLIVNLCRPGSMHLLVFIVSCPLTVVSLSSRRKACKVF